MNEGGGGGDERRFNAYILYITYIPLQPHRPNCSSRERDLRAGLRAREEEPRYIGDTNDFFFSLPLFFFFNNSP